jgi:hypothetical protein
VFKFVITKNFCAKMQKFGYRQVFKNYRSVLPTAQCPLPTFIYFSDRSTALAAAWPPSLVAGFSLRISAITL